MVVFLQQHLPAKMALRGQCNKSSNVKSCDPNSDHAPCTILRQCMNVFFFKQHIPLLPLLLHLLLQTDGKKGDNLSHVQPTIHLSPSLRTYELLWACRRYRCQLTSTLTPPCQLRQCHCAACCGRQVSVLSAQTSTARSQMPGRSKH